MIAKRPHTLLMALVFSGALFLYFSTYVNAQSCPGNKTNPRPGAGSMTKNGVNIGVNSTANPGDLLRYTAPTESRYLGAFVFSYTTNIWGTVLARTYVPGTTGNLSTSFTIPDNFCGQIQVVHNLWYNESQGVCSVWNRVGSPIACPAPGTYPTLISCLIRTANLRQRLREDVDPPLLPVKFGLVMVNPQLFHYHQIRDITLTLPVPRQLLLKLTHQQLRLPLPIPQLTRQPERPLLQIPLR